ncbi:transmembrane protein 70 homolog, mitochondrial-like [Mercenaria mercenaria]|uniref:transmembrane protein 70 homolog, mitochondrial-like n=1 Tax=Mercenaria mercenaria TaxID=6596 RepID=UPI00234E3AB1|nr:transmembrane protein 70 homolog, mitochondrial-like [Mercenaria mercenaria]
MSTLLRIGHCLKGRIPAQVVVVFDGQRGLMPARTNDCANLQQFHSLKSNYHQLQSSCNTLVSQQTRAIDSRTLKTNASDNIDEDSRMPLTHPTKGVLVYAGRMTQYIKGLKTLSLSTSLLALLAQPMVLSAAKDDLLFKAGLMGSISAALFSTPALVHFVTKKYVTDVYFNEDTKMFTLAYKSFFLRRKELQYRAGDVVIPFAPRMFVTHIVKGRSFFIELEEFRNKEIYKHMVGYDKPMDWGIGTQNVKTKPKKKKKFGLFEDEDEKEKQMAEKRTPPEFISKQMMFDDDDDDFEHSVKEKQRRSKMH